MRDTNLSLDFSRKTTSLNNMTKLIRQNTGVGDNRGERECEGEGGRRGSRFVHRKIRGTFAVESYVFEPKTMNHKE